MSADALPSSFRAIRRSLRLGYGAQPLLIIVACATTLAAAVPDALFALALATLTDAVLAHGRILPAATLLAGVSVGGWLLSLLSDRANRRLADLAGVPIEAHVAKLHARLSTLEHHERADYADRLAVLRDAPAALSGLYQSLFSTVGAVIRLLITVALLMSVRPALGLLGVFAIPTVLVSSWRGGVEQTRRDEVARHERRARHFFTVGTTAAAGKEVRVTGVGERVREWWWEARRNYYRPLARTRWASACWQSGAFALFGAAFVVAVAAVADAGPGRVLLVLAAGGRLSQYIGQTVNDTHFFRAIWLDVARRMTWLEELVAAADERAEASAPDTLQRGIRLEQVTFRYPGSAQPVLDDVTLGLPAGGVVALVGENGSGKSTLVKLLCRLYQPATGRVTVDGIDLRYIPAAEWSGRVSAAFQDFATFEYQVRESVGIGDLGHVDDPTAVWTAIDRAGAADLVSGLGLQTQLGASWPGGVELSRGQWQKLALARGFMRPEPLLLVLDEPTSALDAETEHALFEQYAAASRARSRRGRITLLVSHRFSTVRMADLIVVLDGGRIAEQGSHEELLVAGGRYAELYRIQAAAYR